MNCTVQEILQYVREEDVKFIRLAFCDIFGRQKNVSVMPQELERAFDTGIAFDASAIRGFGGAVHSDLFLHPDSSTIAVLPWRPEHGRVVRMFCDITHPDGTPFENDTRSLLKRATADASEAGVSFRFGSELEFYLFNTDENGQPTRVPYDNAGYMDIAPDDRGENVRREICLALEQMGISPESSHHEEGPGQNEVDFRYADPLSAADNAVTFCSVVRNIAARNGLFADFSPKPLPHTAGNGFHINFSARRNGEDVTPFVIAGFLDHIRDLTVFLNPVEDSYARLGNFKAPRFVSWSKENRSPLIRVPAAEGEYRRAELRSPDPLANPYLAFALLIYAGLDGIACRLSLPEAADFDLFSAGADVTKRFPVLPAALAEAKAAAVTGFAAKHLPETVLREYCR